MDSASSMLEIAPGKANDVGAKLDAASSMLAIAPGEANDVGA